VGMRIRDFHGNPIGMRIGMVKCGNRTENGNYYSGMGIHSCGEIAAQHTSFSHESQYKVGRLKYRLWSKQCWCKPKSALQMAQIFPQFSDDLLRPVDFF